MSRFYSLLYLETLQIIRTKLLVFVMVMSFVIQFVGLKLMHSLTLSYQGVISVLVGNQALFISLFLQMFTGAFLAATYGIWVIPYLHKGPRSSLMHALPLRKEVYPVVYSFVLFLLLAGQYFCMLLGYGAVFGFSDLWAVGFNWSGLVTALLLEILAFEALALALGTLSLTVGAIPAFFLGLLSLFLLNVVAIVFRLKIYKYFGIGDSASDTLQGIYRFLPPVGELVYDLRLIFFNPSILAGHLPLWFFWFVVFGIVFGLRIRFLNFARESDSN